MKLDGQVALVTGAASGIGRATALALAQEGADVAINDINAGPAEDLVAQIRTLGRRALLCPADVADQPAVEAVVRRVAAELGRLDILVTVAAYSDREPFYTADMAGFRRTLDVTMWGAFYALRAAVNQMIKQGQGGSCRTGATTTRPSASRTLAGLSGTWGGRIASAATSSPA